MILVKLGKELEDGKFSFICILQIESIKTALSLTTPIQEMSSFLIKKLDKNIYQIKRLHIALFRHF